MPTSIIEFDRQAFHYDQLPIPPDTLWINCPPGGAKAPFIAGVVWRLLMSLQSNYPKVFCGVSAGGIAACLGRRYDPTNPRLHDRLLDLVDKFRGWSDTLSPAVPFRINIGEYLKKNFDFPPLHWGIYQITRNTGHISRPDHPCWVILPPRENREEHTYLSASSAIPYLIKPIDIGNLQARDGAWGNFDYPYRPPIPLPRRGHTITLSGSPPPPPSPLPPDHYWIELDQLKITPKSTGLRFDPKAFRQGYWLATQIIQSMHMLEFKKPLPFSPHTELNPQTQIKYYERIGVYPAQELSSFTIY